MRILMLAAVAPGVADGRGDARTVRRARALLWGAAALLLLGLAGMLMRPATASRRSVSPLPGIALGQPAPDFSLADLQGGLVRLSRLRGRWVLLNFWGVTCPPCQTEMPALEQATEAHIGQGHTAASRPLILGIDGDLDTTREVARFGSRLHVTYPLLVDTLLSVMARYHVGALPTSVLVDPAGRVRSVYLGAMSRAQIERGLSGRA